MNNTTFLTRFALYAIWVVGLTACISSGPATKYYSLFVDPNLVNRVSTTGLSQDTSLGIGPVYIPEYLNNPAIVSLTESQQVRIAGYDAWAGSLKEAMTRVLADHVSQATGLDNIWGFPWDNRVRPQYQVRIVVEEFAGQRNGVVKLNAKWTLLNQYGDEVLLVSAERLSENAQGADANAYVAALNTLLNRLASSIAEKAIVRLAEVK